MKPWTFVHATDIHVGSPRSFRFAPAWNENWQTARQQILDLDPSLLLVGGDITRDGALPEHKYELEQIKADFDTLPFPYYVTPGNMDTGNKHTDVQGPHTDKRDDLALNLTSDELHRFEDVFGPHCWTFIHNNVRFSSFCDMVAGSGLPEEPALWDWLETQRGKPRAQHHVWMIHSAVFVDDLHEPNFDITDPRHYHDWYFALDEPYRGRIVDVFKATGTTLVLGGHVHCRKKHHAEGMDFHINPSTAFKQWGSRWPDGDDSLGFVRYDVTEDSIKDTFIPLARESKAKGYGPGGHPLPEHRDYSLAWEE
jgi:3',5'-cyclic AMP phosphodiesterase CpdA